ncbi:MAG: DUF6948 domain-containing protein [Enterovibrio sp.]
MQRENEGENMTEVTHLTGEKMDIITINGEEYRKINQDLSDYFIIRTDSAGVHFGKIARRDGKEVELSHARRIWYWKGAASLSQLARDGVSCPGDCKFSVVVNSIILTESIEIIRCTDKAAKCILEVPSWTA